LFCFVHIETRKVLMPLEKNESDSPCAYGNDIGGNI